MTEPFLPVWYLQVGYRDERGAFVTEGQGSGVLISVRKNGETRPKKMLLTAQHVLRSGKSNNKLTLKTGPFFKHIKAWAPNTGYNEATAIEVTLYNELLPDENTDLVNPEDLLFLEVPAEASGSLPCQWLLDSECQQGLGNLNIVGFISGDYLIRTHQGIVKAAHHPGWTFTTADAVHAISILSPGSGTPAPGTSGGGVFHGTKYAGVYRGTFVGTGQHLFLPVTRLREWCRGLDHELLNWNIEGAVNDVQKGLVRAEEEMKANEPLKKAVDSSAALVRTLKDTLGLFKTYKELHDCLHTAQLQLPSLENSARTLNTVTESVDTLDQTVELFQNAADSAKSLIAELPSEPVTLRSKESAWQKRFQDAVHQARAALNQGQSAQAQLAGKTLRSIIKIQHPRINGELRSCVEGLDLQGLKTLFAALAEMPGVGEGNSASFRDGRDASGQINQQLQAQLTGHNSWQDIDTDLWNVEEELVNAIATSSAIVGALWHQVCDRLQILISEEPSAVWSKNATELQNQVSASFNASNWNEMNRQFSRFQRVCRRRFYDVDRTMKETAEKTSELTTILNQILAQLAS